MEKAPFRDRIIPWYFVMFFVVVASVNAVFVYLATGTHSGLVTENAYEKGLAYDQVLTDVKAQEALGWNVNVQLLDKRLIISALDAKNAPLNNAKVIAHISRPTLGGHDFTVTLDTSDNGTYYKDIDFPLLGQWDVGTVITWQQTTYQKQQRVVVK